MTKTVKFLWNTVMNLILVVVVAMAILLVGVRLVGLRPLVVLSGSMEPTYHVGSMIYVKSVDPETIEVGDPITFLINEDLDMATHRVIEIDAENQHFYTKGDANDAADGAPVHFENLVGKPIFTIPKLGYISDWITNPPGLYIAGTGMVMFLILLFVPDILAKADEADRKAEEKKRKAEEKESADV